MGMGFQTRCRVLDKEWGSRYGDGVPDMGMGFQTRCRVLDKEWGSRHEDGASRHGLGFQTSSGVSNMGMVFQTWGWGS